jgi:CheY-like chemotaxis protein
MTPMVKEVVKLLRGSLSKTIEIRQNVASSAGIVLADPIQIHQLLMNLCTNAAHAMQKTGGILEVSLANVDMEHSSAYHDFDLKPGPYVELSVGDTGCGMDQAIVERIFDPFFSTKTFGEGSGMGLAVVHGIVKSLDGAIKVETELGKGSTFRVFLPRIALDVDHETDRVRLTFRDGKDPRILLVDHDATLLKVGKRMLERFGYRVTTTNGGIEALEVFLKNPEEFDLIITDQAMSKMDGMEFAKAATDVRPDIPVVLCAGYCEDIDHAKMKGVGIREFVKKPIVFSELAIIARKLLEQKQSG